MPFIILPLPLQQKVDFAIFPNLHKSVKHFPPNTTGPKQAGSRQAAASCRSYLAKTGNTANTARIMLYYAICY